MGTSSWLSPLTNATVTNSTRIGIAQAALQYGGGSPSVCEQCGMDVDITGQARFKIYDSTGTLTLPAAQSVPLDYKEPIETSILPRSVTTMDQIIQ